MRSIPEHLTPAFATWLFGILSSLWFALLVIVSHVSSGDVLGWSVAGVGLMIAYYYGQTGFACVIYFRRYIFKSVKNFFFVGAAAAHRRAEPRVHLRLVVEGHDPLPTSPIRRRVGSA